MVYDLSRANYKGRRVLLDKELHVVAFISCITAVLQRKQFKRKAEEVPENDFDDNLEGTDKADYHTVPGISFWIAFNWPQYELV